MGGNSILNKAKHSENTDEWYTDRKTIEKIVKRYAEQDSYKENTKFEKESFVLIQDILEEAGELEKRVEYETLVTTEFSEKY